jgi:predicted dienelactone hydrolase
VYAVSIGLNLVSIKNKSWNEAAMKLLRNLLLGMIVIVGILAVYVLNPDLPEPQGEQSASLYEPGNLGVNSEALALIDSSRSTMANGTYEGSDSRLLEGYVWYPETSEAGPFPLVVYSHGYMSSVDEADYMVDFLVPKGYVVVAVNYPLSNGTAPGGPIVTDVIHQAGDVSFVIDQLLARNTASGDRLQGMIDPQRIAAVGLSLGGLTTQLAAYHPEARDPRIQTAVSIAGPSAMLEREFFQTTDMPFMMIGGTDDAIVPYEMNAAPMPDKVNNSWLVTLDGGSHVGFVTIASTFLRWFEHPDALVCPMLLAGLENGGGSRPETIMEPNPSIGISATVSEPCPSDDFNRAMRPGQQQMLTRLAIYAFLESTFAADPSRRQAMQMYLESGLVGENAAVSIRQSDR